MELYPLKFKPIYKERVWGGNKLSAVFNRKVNANNRIGESWEISAVKGNLSHVSNGFLKGNDIQDLIEIYMGEIVGDKVFEKFGIELPLLFKLIDSAERLSVQVHPNNELALERHKAYGKTEMWYVIDAKPDALIYVGFKHKISKEQFMNHINKGTLLDIMNVEKVKAGDVFFLPAGRIHAIGEGLLIAEIQQTSDVTYRIYDWGRENDPATAREMHIDLAIDAIDYNAYNKYKSDYIPKQNEAVNLVQCPYFTTNLLELNEPKTYDYTLLDSFVVYMCLHGSAEIKCAASSEHIMKGETILIPAAIGQVKLIPHHCPVKLLEIYVD
ncbi:MAG: class I mannose-6-phosphate isomerase [Prevotellaceae bacterium]|jgi:mannose-6-phosphate isomerase|nr:class I mannose-6-phosphate isomerase [Prevotellaceae bacterium]